MALRIASVLPGGLADRAGLRAGDLLEHIGGEPLLDHVDYQYLTAGPHLRIGVQREGQAFECTLQKREGAPLGLELDSDLMSNPKHCANNCMFCFVNQLPKGMRPSLYIKDDDWRLSLMTGNYITLTNLPERELQRIIDRRASPLYLSVHTTDGALRTRMLSNPRANRILEHLRRFAEAGLSFHCQVVLCPGVNDGAALDHTLGDLYALRPHARSVALVPVGLTKHREGLSPLKPYTREQAVAVLTQADPWRERSLAETGSRFVFPADELYQIAERPIPSHDAYEDFCQIENGVGLLSLFEQEFLTAARFDPEDAVRARRVAIATGTSAAGWMRTLIATQPLQGVEVTVHAIVNRFFGETVTVAGLVTGGDILAQLTGLEADELLIPGNMLRAGEPVFLDGMTLEELESGLGVPIRVVTPDGAELLYALRGTDPSQ